MHLPFRATGTNIRPAEQTLVGLSPKGETASTVALIHERLEREVDVDRRRRPVLWESYRSSRRTSSFSFPILWMNHVSDTAKIVIYLTGDDEAHDPLHPRSNLANSRASVPSDLPSPSRSWASLRTASSSGRTSAWSSPSALRPRRINRTRSFSPVIPQSFSTAGCATNSSHRNSRGTTLGQNSDACMCETCSPLTTIPHTADIANMNSVQFRGRSPSTPS